MASLDFFSPGNDFAPDFTILPPWTLDLVAGRWHEHDRYVLLIYSSAIPAASDGRISPWFPASHGCGRFPGIWHNPRHVLYVLPYRRVDGLSGDKVCGNTCSGLVSSPGNTGKIAIFSDEISWKKEAATAPDSRRFWYINHPVLSGRPYMNISVCRRRAIFVQSV